MDTKISKESIFGLIENKRRHYKSLPFWSFNDALEKDELIYQIEQMAEKGCGGYFMHARSGLLTDYMGKEWFNAIGECLDKGGQLNVDSYVYDENGWPSGFADGAVTKANPDYCLKWIEHIETDKPQTLQNVLGLYIVKNGDAVRVDSAYCGKVHAVVLKQTLEYVDTMNEAAVKCFIDLTYEVYRKKFGNKIKGFFTDEPQYGRRTFPWSYKLENEFFDTYGYDLTEKLLSLFVDLKSSDKVRNDFYTLTADKIKNSYYKQIYDFCSKQGYIFTGHGFDENTLSGQAMNCGDIMQLYEYMHMPGIDWLGREARPMFIPRQASSAAAHTGKDRILTESFALCGWGVGLERLKSIAERQIAGGTNVLCQHLFAYSLKGQRKRDYPPSHFLHQAWWEKYSHFNDYITDLSCFLSQCKNSARLLVLSPVKSAYLLLSNNKQKSESYDAAYTEFIKALDDNGVNYDLGSENILARHAVITDGIIKVGKDCRYKYLLLPDCINIGESTAELINKFIKSGGSVFYTGSFPSLCDGYESKALNALEKSCVKIENIKDLTALSKGKEYFIKSGENLVFSQKSFGSAKVVFAANSYNAYNTLSLSVSKGINVYNIDLAGKGVSTIADPENIEIKPYGSVLLIITKDELGGAKTDCFNKNQCFIKTDKALWEIQSLDDNVIVLDRGSYSLDGADFTAMPDIRLLFEQLMKERKNRILKIRHNVYFETVPETAYFATETPEKKKIFINGDALKFEACGYYIDKSIIKANIRDYIVKGNNEIIIETQFNQSDYTYHVHNDDVMETEKNKILFDTELENSYITGSFSVKDSTLIQEQNIFESGGSFYIDAPEAFAESDKLTSSGLLFYAGKTVLKNTFTIKNADREKAYFFEAQSFADYFMLEINGKLIYDGFSIRIKCPVNGIIKEGRNDIKVTLYSSLRNVFGPHHSKLKDPDFIGPSSFTNNPGWCDPEMPLWTDKYYFIPYGFVLKTQ